MRFFAVATTALFLCLPAGAETGERAAASVFLKCLQAVASEKIDSAELSTGLAATPSGDPYAQQIGSGEGFVAPSENGRVVLATTDRRCGFAASGIDAAAAWSEVKSVIAAPPFEAKQQTDIMRIMDARNGTDPTFAKTKMSEIWLTPGSLSMYWIEFAEPQPSGVTVTGYVAAPPRVLVVR